MEKCGCYEYNKQKDFNIDNEETRQYNNNIELIHQERIKSIYQKRRTASTIGNSNSVETKIEKKEHCFN